MMAAEHDDSNNSEADTPLRKRNSKKKARRLILDEEDEEEDELINDTGEDFCRYKHIHIDDTFMLVGIPMSKTKNFLERQIMTPMILTQTIFLLASPTKFHKRS